jgi:hypothetical protein
MCSVYARACEEQAIGHAGHPSAYLLFEAPTPWPYCLFESSDDFRSLQALRMRHYESGFLFSAVALAPDRDYSRAGIRRVIHLRRPDGPFDQFLRKEYLLPAGDGVFLLARVIFDQSDHLRDFDRHRVDTGPVRDLLVCTHGAVDVCCGKFGYPIYQSLRGRYRPDTSPDVRVWRASHFGGHRFAPTMLDLAEGRYWAFLDDAVLRQIVERSGPIDPLLSHYRGWAGADTAWSQVVEGEAFRREGWDWLDYRKSVTTRQFDSDECRAQVRIDFVSADGLVRGAYEATVEVAESRPMPLCGERPEEAHYEGHQYQVSRMSRIRTD